MRAKHVTIISRYGIFPIMLYVGISYWRPPDHEQYVKNDIVNTTGADAKLLELRKPTVQEGTALEPHRHNQSLAEVCKRTASSRNELVVSLMGSGVHDMYMNFYYSSILKHNITNMLFIATDTSACNEVTEELQPNHPVSCFVAYEDTASGKQSIYGSGDFNRKAIKRARIVYDIIKLGYSVISSDIDIVFLHNPLPVIREMCALESCDIAIQWNTKGEYNSGFMYVKPTERTQELYARLLKYGAKHHTDDQVSLNKALKGDNNIKVTTLRKDRFPVGRFFPWGRECLAREFSNETVIVHNNFLRSPVTKMHRFKQCCLWEYDGKDGYFTSTTRKYLLLSNEYQINQNMQAFLNGFTIAAILRRTFILPEKNSEQFYGVLANEYYDLYAGKYRTAAFLSHRLVPGTVKMSRSPAHCISRDSNATNCSVSEVILKGDNPMAGPSEQDILKWFKDIKESILIMTPIIQDLQRINYTKILGEKERVFEGNRETHTSVTLWASDKSMVGSSV